MDKKLLLAIQYQCNSAGLAVPWTEIGAIMGEGITGGAVIQHLAKLRIRMVAQDLSVPPPLRRGGGGSRLSTSASSAPRAKATPTKNGTTQANPKSTHTKPAKSNKAGKKAASGSDESEEEDDSWNNDESDTEYGEPHAKRAKSNAKGRTSRKIKTEGSDEEITAKAPKRKHQSFKSSPRELSAYGTTDINGNKIEDDSDVEDDTQSGLSAAGAPWLALEDDYVSHPNTGKKTPYKQKSLIVSLPTISQKIGAVLNDEDTSDDESEEEVAGGEVESVVNNAHVLSNEDNSPYNQNFENLAAAQLEPAPNSNYDNGMYNTSYHVGQQAMPFNGGLYADRQTFGDAFDNGNGANFDLFSTNLDEQGAGLFAEFNGTNTNFSFQTDRGYGASSNAFDGNAGGLPFLNGHNQIQPVPYPIQTSWPSNHNSSVSNETSVNQTPAGTSAGADVGTGYFGNGSYGLGSFDNVNIDFSANDGSDMLFDPENFDGNFVGGGLFDNDRYGS